MPPAPRPNPTPRFSPLARAEPFTSAEEAWFWTMAALTARRDGARVAAGKGLAQRPCEPDDVIKCLDRLYRQRRIDLTHARFPPFGASAAWRPPLATRRRAAITGFGRKR